MLHKVSFKHNSDTLLKMIAETPWAFAWALWLFPEFSCCLCFLIHIIRDMLSWVCKMSEHMELDFLTNILA